MRGAAASMRVLRPRTPAEAVALYAADPAAVPLAGGTDFMVLWNQGGLDGRAVLDLSALKAWRGVRTTPAGLSLGALTTHAELRDDPLVRRRFPLLAMACAAVGAEQIQNRGTLGGNVANASPAGDTLPVLAVHEAALRTLSPRGEGCLPLLEVFAGVKKTTLGPSELITAVDLPFAPPPTGRMFRKVGTRSAMAISKTVAAGLLWLTPDGTVRELRFALGSMAPTVRRLKSVEAFVEGKRLTPEVVREAGGLLARDVSPIDDARSTARYRLRVSRNLLEAFLSGAAR